MADQSEKSKRQSDGNPDPSQRDEFVIFLDENLHKCAPLLAVLETAGVPYELHKTHFRQGELDTIWLPHVCSKGWAILTKDKGIRYSRLEIDAIIRNNGRQFYFRSGNWDKAKMADVLSKALPKMKRMFKRIAPPFLASITESGEVHLRYDRRGSIHEQKRESEPQSE